MVGVFIMSEMAVPQRGRMFGAAAVGTLVLGMAAALAVIFHLRPPPPVVVQSPPEIKEVSKVVYVPAPAPAAPAPAPAPVATPASDPVPPPPPETPPYQPEPVPGVWNGVWRRKNYPLPMFRLMSRSDNMVVGTCAPNWGTVLPFSVGAATQDAVEFVVDDQVFRVHVRMTMVGEEKAKVEQWVTDDDWAVSLERALRLVKTPQQAAIARAKLERDAQRFRKPVTVGIFTRQSGE